LSDKQNEKVCQRKCYIASQVGPPDLLLHPLTFHRWILNPSYTYSLAIIQSTTIEPTLSEKIPCSLQTSNPLVRHKQPPHPRKPPSISPSSPSIANSERTVTQETGGYHPSPVKVLPIIPKIPGVISFPPEQTSCDLMKLAGWWSVLVLSLEELGIYAFAFTSISIVNGDIRLRRCG